MVNGKCCKRRREEVFDAVEESGAERQGRGGRGLVEVRRGFFGFVEGFGRMSKVGGGGEGGAGGCGCSRGIEGWHRGVGARWRRWRRGRGERYGREGGGRAMWWKAQQGVARVVLM